MSAFRVAHNYYAVYRSVPVAFAAGAVVDVDDATADWVNRDSPGCLVATDAPDVETTPDDTGTEAPAASTDATDAPDAPDVPDVEQAPKRGRRASA